MINSFLNLTGKPWLIIAASALALIAVFFLRKWITPWLQKRQDSKNAAAAIEQSRRSQQDNQDMNSQVDNLFNK